MMSQIQATVTKALTYKNYHGRKQHYSIQHEDDELDYGVFFFSVPILLCR